MELDTPPAVPVDRLRAAAETGLVQLQNLVSIVRQLFTVLGYGDAANASQQQAALQQQYVATMTELQKTLAECGELAARVADPAGHGSGPAATEEAAAGRAQELGRLQSELAGRNELTKRLIDQLRGMLESVAMWESYRAQLERVRVAEGQ